MITKIVSTQIAQANQGGLKKQKLIIVMIFIMKNYKANEIENKGDYYDNTKGGFICNLHVWPSQFARWNFLLFSF